MEQLYEGDQRVVVRSMDSDYNNQFNLAIMRETIGSDERHILVGNIWKPYEPGSGESTFTLRRYEKNSVLQQLADLIFKEGIRPTEMKPLESELVRVENHLDDSRIIRDRLLSIVEKTG